MIVQIISSHALSFSLLYTVWVLYELEIPLDGLKCEKQLLWFVPSFYIFMHLVVFFSANFADNSSSSPKDSVCFHKG